MTYELAKQLKDAGFPQSKKEGRFLVGENMPLEVTSDVPIEWIIYVPTLSDLIEACEDSFGILERRVGSGWRVRRQYAPGTISDLEISGDTPEEAVSKLWLELNKR